MATTADFVGRNCPLCGAINSLEADECRGEVACVECARVVCMGLEENLETRFLKDATYEDADRHASTDPSDGSVLAGGKSTTRTRREAAAQYSGRGPSSSAQASSDEMTYLNTRLHPRMTQRIEVLGQLSRRGQEMLVPKAIALAKHFCGARRSRGETVDKMNETAAACVMLAAEQLSTPIPVAEMRMMDPTVKDVDGRRQDIIAETKRTKEFSQLKDLYAVHLTRYYIRLMQLQRSAYDTACMAMLKALQVMVSDSPDIAQMVTAERVMAAVLLCCTEPSLRWEGKPHNSTNSEPATSVYDGFASTANIPAARVRKLMQIITAKLSDITPVFQTSFQTIVSAGDNQQSITAGHKRERSPTS